MASSLPRCGLPAAERAKGGVTVSFGGSRELQPSLRDLIAARRAGRLRRAPLFRLRPEPRSIGDVIRGQRLLAGRFDLGGHHVSAPERAPWDLPLQPREFEAALHGFGWLDDLAALGTREARGRARDWTQGWIARFGTGRGPGWTAQLAGRRVMRWIHHALMLRDPADEAANAALCRALGRQTRFLAARWTAAPEGLARFEALAGLIHGAAVLEGLERHLDPARAALEAECAARIDAQGGIATRNPEELLEILALLIWMQDILAECGAEAGPECAAAIARIAPVLRALRHADASLARFHGGGRGEIGRLEHALAAAVTREAPGDARAMGYARLAAGRTTVIVDAERPPEPRESHGAHASTLAFELTSGRRPVVVSCGAGRGFGPDWLRAARATPAHSTLAIEAVSSSRFGPAGRREADARLPLMERPGAVSHERRDAPHATGLLLGHDGYFATHGLTHLRRLDLSADGRALTGEDMLAVITAADRRRFARYRAAYPGRPVNFGVRFHLHPDIDATLQAGVVTLRLPSGEVWQFEQEGARAITLAPSVYLERGRVAPQPTVQIVLSGQVGMAAGQLNWTLAKAADTPVAVRDLAHDDMPIEA